VKSLIKRRFKTRHWVTVCIFAVSIVGFVSSLRSEAVTPAYTITDLGTLGGSPNQSRGYGINNCGTTVGDSLASTGQHPFYRKGLTMTDITPSSALPGISYSVNSTGTVVGYAETSAGQRGFYWRDDNDNGVSDPGEFHDFFPSGFAGVAYDINDSNRVVGVLDAGGVGTQAFVWDSTNGFKTIDPPAIWAQSINNAGNIALWGSASYSSCPPNGQPCQATHAFILKNNTYIDLGTLDNTTLSLQSFSWRISEDGHVVGYSQTPSNNASLPIHPFLWFDANNNNTSDAGEMKDLGTLSGVNAYAYDINASGYVIGTSEVSGGGTHAYVWHDDNANGANDAGEMKDLNGQFTDATWTTLVEARSINDGGQIVGWGTKSNGETHAFLLTPTGFTPPPCPGASPSPTPTPATTSLISVQGAGTYGSTATLSATLNSNDMPVSGKTISFTLNGSAVCGGSTGVTCPATNASGIASLSGVSLAGINAGNYPNAVGASFAGDSSFASSNQNGQLTVLKASATITLTNLTQVFDGLPKFATASTTPSGLTVNITYSQNGNPVSSPTSLGAYAVSAVISDANYQGSTTGTLNIVEPAPVILLETGTSNAAAVDSVTFFRGPFRVTDNFNFSGDHLTRIIIFTLPLANPDQTLSVKASGIDLPIESVGNVTGVSGLNASYIIVKLPQGLQVSQPTTFGLTVTLRNVTSNTADLIITP